MMPVIQKGDLTALHLKRQKKVCGCDPLCKEFFTFVGEAEDFVLCAGDARQFGFEILQGLGLLTKEMAFPKSKYGWTTEQERFIKTYLTDHNCFKEDGHIKHGTYALLAEMIGKSREQIKNKIQHMRKEGKL